MSQFVWGILTVSFWKNKNSSSPSGEGTTTKKSTHKNVAIEVTVHLLTHSLKHTGFFAPTSQSKIIKRQEIAFQSKNHVSRDFFKKGFSLTHYSTHVLHIDIYFT